MGGMLTSTRDLAAYVGFLSSAWPPRDDPDAGPVRRASLREMQQVWRPSPATVSRDAVDAPLRLNAGGYGFGLRVWQACSLSHIVAHGGGLPGFGSYMRWLPEHGVAIVAMGNLTYTSWSRVTDDAFDAMLADRRPETAHAATIRRARGCPRSDQPAHRPLGRRRSEGDCGGQPVPGRARWTARRRQVEAIRARLGVCRPDGGFDVENALRGTWKLTCDRGSLRVAVTLAPTVPPQVQLWDITPVRTAAGADRRGREGDRRHDRRAGPRRSCRACSTQAPMPTRRPGSCTPPRPGAAANRTTCCRAAASAARGCGWPARKEAWT